MEDKEQTVLINTPYGVLTKQDIYDYYRNPKIKQRLLELRKQNIKDIIVRQKFDEQTVVLRRKDSEGQPLKLTPETYDRLVKSHLTEIHPVFGKTTKNLVVDIDPGKNVSWEKTKKVTKQVAQHMKATLPVKRVALQFSGNRGFYVKGELDRAIDIDTARARLRRAIQPLLTDDIVAQPPKAEQIRLDISPMKYRGSIRAPYSLDSRTGLVAAPVSQKELPQVEKSDFTISKHSSAMFAPGIPIGRVVHPIPEVRNKQWQLAIQEHAARRAGKHWDLRLVDPETQLAHSFAMRRMALPPKDRVFLAVQQPTHTAQYATTFEGTIPQGYGAGKVRLKEVAPIKVEIATPKHIIFSRNGQRYVLFRMQNGDKWGIKRL